MEKFLSIGVVLLIIASFTAFVAWATHVVWIITALISDAWTWGQVAIGVIGAFMPPVGVIHGFMIWFGVGA